MPDETLATIWWHARLLPERLADALESRNHDLHDARKARWMAVAKIATPDDFRDAITAAGWEFEAVESLLAEDRSYQPSAAILPRELPSWLSTLAEIIEIAAVAENDCADYPFGELIAPFLLVARRKLSDRLDDIDVSETVLRDVEMILAGSITDLLAPCLLAEFDAIRPSGLGFIGGFIGEHAAVADDRLYRTFVLRHRTDGLRSFLSQYAVAARLAAMQVETWARQWSEVLQRLDRDLDLIRQTLLPATSAQSVISIDGGLSDPHDGGRTVAILTFDDGKKLVYKPRSLAPECLWHDLVSLLGNDFTSLEAQAVDCGTHGWMAYVEHAEQAGLQTFYQSAGALLAIARTTGFKDLHYENVIVAGNSIVPIDLETLAQSWTLSTPRDTWDRIAKDRDAWFCESVRDTGALPFRYSLSDHQPIDISAFADLGDHQHAVRSWFNLGSDAIAQRIVQYPANAKNLPWANGKIARPADYEDDILAGFNAAWNALLAARRQLIAQGGLIERLASLPVRHIYRPTEVYYRLLARARKPENLMRGIDHSIELEALRAASDAPDRIFFSRMVDFEIEALGHGDIPRFTMRPSATLVFHGPEVVGDNRYATKGLTSLENRLASLDHGCRAEADFIRASLRATTYGIGAGDANEPLRMNTPGEMSRNEALDLAREIGRNVRDAAIPRRDGGLSWIGVGYVASAGGVAPEFADDGLYQGTAGIGLFFAALHRITGESSWLGVAEAAFTDLCRLAEEAPANEIARLLDRIGPGFAGLGGHIYSLALAADLLGSARLREASKRLASWASVPVAEKAPSHDLLHGCVGLIPGLIATGNRAKAEIIAKHASLSVTGQRPEALGGFGHGRMGGAAALAQIGAYSAEIREVVETLAAPLHAATQQSDQDPTDPIGWCRGPVGRAMAHLTARRCIGQIASSDIAAAERVLDENITDPSAVDHLCCGLAGCIDGYLCLEAFGSGTANKKARRLASAMALRARATGGFRLHPDALKPFPSAGFFQGTSGIGYTLLRLASPDLLPSVLLTETRYA